MGCTASAVKVVPVDSDSSLSEDEEPRVESSKERVKRRGKKGKPTDKHSLTVIVVGPSNVGKTTVVANLTGNPIDDIVPTVGFDPEQTRLDDGQRVNIYDVGGGKRIRGIWDVYMPEVHGVVYVMDASDEEAQLDARQCFQALVTNPLLEGKPIAIFLNKADKLTKCNRRGMIKVLSATNMVSDEECPVQEFVTCANGDDIKARKEIKRGIHWLVERIDANRDEIQAKVDADVKKARAKQKKLKAEKKKRIEGYRKEREEKAAAGKEEEAERKKSSSSSSNSGDEATPTTSARTTSGAGSKRRKKR